MSRLARFASAVASPLVEGRSDLGQLALVWGSAIGEMVPTGRFLDRLLLEGPEQASPLAFQNSVYNAPAGHLGLVLGLTGSSETLSAGGATGLAALLRGCLLLATGRAPAVLVVAGDDLHPHLERSWSMLGHSRPPGEAFAAMLLLPDAEATADHPIVTVYDGVPPGPAPLVARHAALPDESVLAPIPGAIAPEAAFGLSPCLGLAVLALASSAGLPLRVVDRDGPRLLGADFHPAGS